MLNDPRRYYFFLNLQVVFQHFVWRFGSWLPSIGYWCSEDGSLVTSVEEAGVVCKLTGVLTVYSAFLKIILMAWMVTSWHFIAGKLGKTGRVEYSIIFCGKTMPEIMNGMFIAAIVLLLAAMVILSLLFGTFIEGLTGVPQSAVCLPLQTMKSNSLILLYCSSMAVSAIIFVKLSFRFRHFKIARQRSGLAGTISGDEKGHYLGRWERRHQFFFLLALLPSLLYSLRIALPNTDSYSNGMFQAYNDFIDCASSFSCDRNCKVEFGLSVSPLDVATVVVLLPTFMLSFGWFFFKEIKWPGLRPVRI